MSYFAGYRVTLVYQETAMQMLLQKYKAVTYNIHFCILYWPETPYLYTDSFTMATRWDSQPNNKLHKIYPNVHHILPLSSQFSRRDRVVYNRLKIGHSYPKHSYLLHKDSQPACIPCHSPFLEHILTECINFQPIWVNYYSTSDKVHPGSILQCMKDICLYKKL